MTDAPAPESIGACITRLAREKPDAPALSCEDVTYSYAQLEAAANRVARGLQARGVQPGDFVTVSLPNDTDFLLAAVAIWKVGATPQPVSWRLPPAELAAIVELASPALVIAAPEVELAGQRASVAELLAASDDASPLPDVTAPVWKAPTSGGSTGRPKLILSGLPGVVLEAQQQYFRTGSDDVCVMPGPLYHNAPFTICSVALTAGAHVVLLRKFDAEVVLAEVQRRRATWLYLVPTMMSRMWRLGDEVRARYDVSTVRTLWHMAAPCPHWLKEAFIGWFGGEAVLELYAGTEAQAGTTITGTEWLAHRGSVGRVNPPGEMKAVGADGETLPPGEVGEIYMRRGPGMPSSYRYLGADARIMPAEGGDSDDAERPWESLGDMGWLDADGYLYLADRRPDMILVGGGNVYPAEIEAALDEHPDVVSSCVIGLPDEDMGARIHAIVQPRPGVAQAALEAALAEFLPSRLQPYKRPRSYELTAEPLRDDAGKVRRSQLRAARLPAVEA